MALKGNESGGLASNRHTPINGSVHRQGIRPYVTFRICCLLIAALALISPAAATTVVRFSFESLCEASDRIVHVTCLESEPVLAEDGIRTRTRFRVMEWVKGEGPDEIGSKEIEIALPGGQIGDQQVTVLGMPVFVAGDETVLFLSGPDGTGSPWPIGLGQGCYHVIADDSGGSAVHLQRGVTPIPAGALFKPVSSDPYRVDLASFLAKVRETVLSPTGTED